MAKVKHMGKVHTWFSDLKLLSSVYSFTTDLDRHTIYDTDETLSDRIPLRSRIKFSHSLTT